MAIKRFDQQSSDRSPENRQPKSDRSSLPKSSDEKNLLLATATVDETDNSEENIRPRRLDDYIGQKDLKEVLKIAIGAAKSRDEALDHLLLYGPPGLGKTTMSLILAAEMGVNCKITAAPALEHPRFCLLMKSIALIA
jgi:Holliday junction DNA helicase RuvB